MTGRKMFLGNGKTVRIDTDLDDLLQELSKKNKISIRQASKELARIAKNMKGEEFVKKIKF